MARLFDDASEQYLGIISAPVTNYPMSMCAWGYTDTVSTSQAIMGVYSGVNVRNYINIWSDGHLYATSSDETYQEAFATVDPSVDTWEHYCGVFAAADDRSIFLNGGNKGTNAVSQTLSGIDRVYIAARQYESSPHIWFSGSLAEAAIWNIALTDSEVASLAAGLSPLGVRPGNLVFYVPLVRDNDEDIIGGLSLTAYNSPTITAHPRIIYPAPPIFYMKAAVGDLDISEADGLTVGESIDPAMSDMGIDIALDEAAYQGKGVRVIS